MRMRMRMMRMRMRMRMRMMRMRMRMMTRLPSWQHSVSSGGDAVPSPEVVRELGQVAPLPGLGVVAVHGDQLVAVLVAAPDHHQDLGQPRGRPRPRPLAGPVVAVVLAGLEAARLVDHAEAAGRQVDQRVALHVRQQEEPPDEGQAHLLQELGPVVQPPLEVGLHPAQRYLIHGLLLVHAQLIVGQELQQALPRQPVKVGQFRQLHDVFEDEAAGARRQLSAGVGLGEVLDLQAVGDVEPLAQEGAAALLDGGELEEVRRLQQVVHVILRDGDPPRVAEIHQLA
ncbi:hypothetical protein EYF80_043943 [Liparis tanakae]|uniref:Uncharacterized protein n=1 Tax=Liparis tanakae TaxID=230148 RepID=A0A4Z2FY86_9TELE|nr:hypothetical protein EYF80_043943 [Liparis tanakae]